MSSSREKARELLQERIGYAFRDETLLREACALSRSPTHKSQRLEFLGDRVLGLIIAEGIFQSSSDSVGDMAVRFNGLVCRDTLIEIAEEIEIESALAKKGGDAPSPSKRADACEALIGAIYLDGGIEAARSFIWRFWSDRFALEASELRDSKSVLQEMAQKHTGALPAYALLEARGEKHALEFTMEVFVEGMGRARGTGRTKRAAEQEAARALLESVEGA